MPKDDVKMTWGGGGQKRPSADFRKKKKVQARKNFDMRFFFNNLKKKGPKKIFSDGERKT